MKPEVVQETPDGPGVYQLRLRLPEPVRIEIGKLGAFDFPAGVYVYTGSALGGLKPRLARHLRASKKLHWHIDYFLRYAEIETIMTHPTQERLECALNRQTLLEPDARVVIRGFGSSDCRCVAHLVYLGGGESADAPDICASPHPNPPRKRGGRDLPSLAGGLWEVSPCPDAHRLP